MNGRIYFNPFGWQEMFWRIRKQRLRTREQGQVLAEAVVVMLLLVVLIGALHQTGRWQFDWSNQWLKTQVAATGVALDHANFSNEITVSAAQTHAWHDAVMRDFKLGQSRWQQIRVNGRFAKPAWRMAGTGQASLDRDVTARIGQAHKFWARHALASQTVARTLLPSISAVEMPWHGRGSATDWLSQWQGSTPESYVGFGR